MTQGPIGIEVEILEVAESIAKQIGDVLPVMVMRHATAERRPKTLRGIGLRVIRWGRDETELVSVPLQGFSDHLGPLGRVDLGVIEQDQGNPPSRLGALDEVIELGDEGLGGAAGSKTPGAPALAPINGGKADGLEIDPWSPDQALTGMALPGPDPGQGRMMPHGHLILNVEVGPRQEGQQIGDIGRNLVPKIRLDESVDIEDQGRGGWRG